MPKKDNSLFQKSWILLAVTVVALVFVMAKGNNKPQTSTVNTISQTKTYKSENLSFSLQIPSESQTLSEIGTGTTFSIYNNEFNIERGGTEFNNLEDYLTDLDKRNKAVVVEDKKLRISNNNSARRLVEVPSDNNLLTFEIFVDGWVYSIFTQSPELYDDLDQIAQSFRYTGN